MTCMNCTDCVELFTEMKIKMKMKMKTTRALLLKRGAVECSKKNKARGIDQKQKKENKRLMSIQLACYHLAPSSPSSAPATASSRSSICAYHALPPLAAVISAGTLLSLRTLTISYPPYAPPTAQERGSLSAALASGRLPALETLHIQHHEEDDSEGLEPGGMEMLMGLAETTRDGTVSSPRLGALELPTPLLIQDLLLLARLVKARRRAQPAVWMSLPDGWWEQRVVPDEAVDARALAFVDEEADADSMPEGAAGAPRPHEAAPAGAHALDDGDLGGSAERGVGPGLGAAAAHQEHRRLWRS
jgi:hypothetical protein